MQPLSSHRFINAALIVAVFTISFVFALSFYQTGRIKRTSGWVDHTRHVIQQIQRITITALDVQAGARGYVMTGDENYITQVNNAGKEFPFHLLTLKSLIADNPQQLVLFDSLRFYVEWRVAISDTLIQMRKQGHIAAANNLVASGIGKQVTQKIRVTGNTMELIENDLLNKRKTANDKSIHYFNTTLYLVLIVVFLLSLLLYYKTKIGFKSQKLSEEKFKALLDAAPDAMIISDEEGIIKMINQRTVQLFGYGAHDLLGKAVETLIFKPGGQMPEKYRKLLQTEPIAAADFEMVAVGKIGAAFSVEVSLSPIKTSDGLLVSASVRDITERKKKQQDVELLLQQINQSNDAIFTVNATLEITNWNYGAEIMYGYTKDEAIGKSSVELLKIDMSDAELEALKDNVMLDGYWTGEIKRFGKNNIEVDVISSITAVKNSDGEISGYISVSYDMGKQKIMQKQIAHLASIVEHSSEAIISRGANKLIISWNEGAEKMFGFTKEEAIGKTALELGIIKFTKEELMAIDVELSIKNSWQGEKIFYTKNGECITGVISANSIKTKAGDVLSESFIIKDITLRKQFEEYLKGYNEELEAKVEERTAEIHKAELRFKAMIENSNDIISLIDENKKIIYRSPAAERVTGFTNEEVSDINSFEKLPHPDDINKLKGFVKEALGKPGIPVHATLRLLKKTGGYRLVDGFVTNFLQDENIKALVINSRDITETREAEEKLAISEKRFRTLIEKAHDVITLMDSSFRLLYRSPAAERITGWANEDMLDVDATRNIHPDDLEEARRIIQQVMANPGVTTKTIFRNRHKDGHYIWMEGVLTNWLHDENVQAIVFNYQDVTERIEAANKITASEERFRNTMDSMIEGVQIIGFDWRYNYVNDALAKHSKYSKEELIGFTVMEKFPGIENSEIFTVYQRCFNERVPVHLENKFEFPDKTVAWFELSFLPVPEGIFILSVDITAKKKAEEQLIQSLHEKELLADKFSVILNRLPANIVLLDARGYIVEVNDGWKEFATANDYSHNEYGLGENYFEICENTFGEEAGQYKKVANGIKAILENQLKEFEFEYACHSPNEERWFRMIVSPLRHTSFYGAVIMHINITELKRLENERLQTKTGEQRNITRAMLQGQERERNQIGRDLHDNVVQLMAATKMKLGLFLSQQANGAPIISQSMSHIQEALTEARNLSHKMVMPRFGSTALKEELERLLYDYFTDKRTVDFNMIKMDEEIVPVAVKETLYRVAQEQLSNIEKYAQCSNISLQLSNDKKNITMTISDNGIGFDVKQERKGIGLTNIYNRAESYGGEASVISSPGYGTTLIIEMPLANNNIQLIT